MYEHSFQCFGDLVLYFDYTVAESKNDVDEPKS